MSAGDRFYAAADHDGWSVFDSDAPKVWRQGMNGGRGHLPDPTVHYGPADGSFGECRQLAEADAAERNAGASLDDSRFGQLDDLGRDARTEIEAS